MSTGSLALLAVAGFAILIVVILILLPYLIPPRPQATLSDYYRRPTAGAGTPLGMREYETHRCRDGTLRQVPAGFASPCEP